MSNLSINIKTIRTRPERNPRKRNTSKIQGILSKEINFTSRRLPDKIKEAFYHELSILLGAGVDIKTALQLATEDQVKPRFTKMFSHLQKQIVEGATLSSAMQQSGQFTPYEFYSVKIGEETGKMVQVLKELAIFYHKKLNQRRQIISAITYPAVILTVAFCAVSFMIAYVVPMFADVLKRTNNELPYVTRLVLSVSDVFRSYIGLLLVSMIMPLVFIVTQRKKAWFRSAVSNLILKTPVVGVIVSKIYLSRFSNTLSLLISARIPLLNAIGLVHKMIGFYPIEKTLETIATEITKGNSLHASMNIHSIFPSKMVMLIKVVEEVNELDVFLQKIAEQYGKDVEHQSNMLGKLLEPIIIIILGVVIGVILIAMYLPLFKLGNSF